MNNWRTPTAYIFDNLPKLGGEILYKHSLYATYIINDLGGVYTLLANAGCRLTGLDLKESHGRATLLPATIETSCDGSNRPTIRT